ncbi:hypothetical protein [Rubellicoccus peritrichatus]|uniref:Uncharacterized protein n=1 Tax=Rubellicoccus peritrichatus TaxID=3080537 RepID=A0AAQ3QUF6_9BACT|nr:hypothetical protein [Puniceicoccus sp. CR14]WOO42331.1 hypothetical protein RZN69_04460 [Puniceicoccus sp. CR14]
MSYPPPSECLPHEPPMVLLHEIKWVNDQGLSASVHLGNNDIFDSRADVPIAWAMEIIAQAAAAYVGINYRVKGYTSGRLIRASSFSANATFIPKSTKLTAMVTKIAESEMGVFLFQGSLSEGDVILAEASFTILVK